MAHLSEIIFIPKPLYCNIAFYVAWTPSEKAAIARPAVFLSRMAKAMMHRIVLDIYYQLLQVFFIIGKFAFERPFEKTAMPVIANV